MVEDPPEKNVGLLHGRVQAGHAQERVDGFGEPALAVGGDAVGKFKLGAGRETLAALVEGGKSTGEIGFPKLHLPEIEDKGFHVGTALHSHAEFARGCLRLIRRCVRLA